MSYCVGNTKHFNIDVYKIIQTIQDEFAVISYKSMQTELKQIPQNDSKQLLSFIMTYIKKVDKTKEQAISKITKLFENNKKQKINLSRDGHFNYFSPANNITSINYLNLKNLPSSPNINHSFFSPDRNTNNNTNITKSKSEKKIKINTTKTNTNNTNNNSNNNNTSNDQPHDVLQTEIEPNKNKHTATQLSLAKDIISFIDDMKALQTSIMNKDVNISIMKKAFEKKKMSLYKDAQQFIAISPLSPTTPSSTYTTSSTQINTNKTNTNNNTNNNNSSFFSNSSTSTSPQNIKDFTETISALRTAIEDIKTNNKFITEQLRTEISSLTSKNEQSISIIKEYETTLIKNITSIKSIYKSLKEYAPQHTLDSLPIQTNTTTSNNNASSLEAKFDWYENEINKLITLIQANNSISRICDLIKVKANEIVQIIQPFLDNNSESELDLNFLNRTSSSNNSYLYEETIILTAIENLKKYIISFSELVIALKDKNDKLQKQIIDTKVKTNTYKALLLQNAVNKITHPTTNSNNNNIDTISHNDIPSNSYETVNQMNMNLIKIQTELINKIEELEIENDKHKESINNLLQTDKDSKNETVPKEKYSYLLNLYTDEQEKSKVYHNKYLSIIQELAAYVKTGEKINLNETHSHNNSNCNFINEQLDSSELGRINENDLVINSGGSNYNRYEQVTISVDRKKYDNVTNELRVIKSQNEKMRKKISNFSGIINTIANIFEKLVNEITLNVQVKEYFILIFRILNYSEDKINTIMSSKK